MHGRSEMNELTPFHKHQATVFTILFFGIFLLTGLFVYPDYGISWDEQYSRFDNARIVYHFVVNGGGDEIRHASEKYHGPAFELFLFSLEKLFSINDIRAVYLMRHLVTFLTFFVAVYFFFLIARNNFNNWKLGLLAAAFLVISPRIFAESFYNSKDLAFLSFFIMAIYSLLQFHRHQDYKWAVVHSFFCAILIDIRILGILIPVFTLFFLLADQAVTSILKTKESVKFKTRPVVVYFILLILLIILFWPVLWLNPVKHFVNAFNEMRKFTWLGSVFYQGIDHSPGQLPWHYIPAWISITTPPLYIFLFVSGFALILFRLIKNPFNFYLTQKTELLSLLCFLSPIVMVIVLNSVIYDGWRHVYFIYPAFILIAVYAFNQFDLFLKKNILIKTRITVWIIVLIFLAHTGYTMIRYHPNQQVYFNRLAGGSLNSAKAKHEFDYWGLAFKQVLEEIVERDTSAEIIIHSNSFPGVCNRNILHEEQRDRLLFSDNIDYCDYFITNYRSHPEDYDYPNEFYSVIIDDAKLASAFRFQRNNPWINKELKQFSDDFEVEQHLYKPISSEQAISGKYAIKIDPSTEKFKLGSIGNDTSLLKKGKIIIRVSIWVYQETIDNSSMIVVEMNSEGSEEILSSTSICNYSNEGYKKWKKITLITTLPELKSIDETVNIYIRNSNNRDTFYLDDYEVSFIELNPL